MSDLVANLATVAASVILAVLSTGAAVSWFTADDCTDAMGGFTGRKRVAAGPARRGESRHAEVASVAALAIDVIAANERGS